jgi:predicted DNA repair protein MutK
MFAKMVFDIFPSIRPQLEHNKIKGSGLGIFGAAAMFLVGGIPTYGAPFLHHQLEAFETLIDNPALARALFNLVARFLAGALRLMVFSVVGMLRAGR